MPTISQLPAATSVSAADAIPISQGGTAKSASIGSILQSAQAIITVDSQSLIGRTSLGAGGPEQINVGQGLVLNGATLNATGFDHASFSPLTTLDLNSDLVVSVHGSPMLMSAAMLRGLFGAGQNVAISAGGVISATGNVGAANVSLGSIISALQVTTHLSNGDLLPVAQTGSTCAITYGNLLNGLTIDQAQHAGPVGDSDTFWAAQGSSMMASQTFAAMWSWIGGKLPLYQAPVTEVTSNTILSTNLHNARIIVCSQPVTITAAVGGLSSGFCCKLINASSGLVSLGAGLVMSSGVPTLNMWQSATIFGLAYSGGTINYASLDFGNGVSANLPGPVGGLTSSALGTNAITISWQAPTTGTPPSGYVTQSRVSGSSSWTSSPLVSSTTYQMSTLTAGTSYDIVVQAVSTNGAGPVSNTLTVSTAIGPQTTAPTQVTGVTAAALSSSSAQIAWLAQTGSAAAVSYTVQYRTSGTSAWTGTISGLTGAGTAVTGLQQSTSYDFAVFGSNSAGCGPPSVSLTAATLAAANAVSSISWNLLPTGTYTKSSGSIGVNAHVSPQPPRFSSDFTVDDRAAVVLEPRSERKYKSLGRLCSNTKFAGNWYAWAEGTDGSAPTPSSTQFAVQ